LILDIIENMIQSFPFLDNIYPIWNDCYNNNLLKLPFFHPAWHDAYFQTIGKNEKPCILYIPELKIIAPFCRNNTAITFSGGKEVSDFQDLVGSEENKYKAWPQILDYFKINRIDNVSLTNVIQNSITVKYFQTELSKSIITPEDTTPTVLLPPTVDEYYESLPGKYRHELRRKIRKFENKYPDTEIKISQNPIEDIEELFKLMKLDERKMNFLTPDMENFFRLLTEKFKDTIELIILKDKAIIIALLMTFVTNDSILLYNSGFDEAKYSGAGLYLKAQNLFIAINHHKKNYNFLQGNERYKYELGGLDYPVVTIKFKT
jgi:hypothetical protein